MCVCDRTYSIWMIVQKRVTLCFVIKRNNYRKEALEWVENDNTAVLSVLDVSKLKKKRKNV